MGVIFDALALGNDLTPCVPLSISWRGGLMERGIKGER